jgi:hypothetical protein
MTSWETENEFEEVTYLLIGMKKEDYANWIQNDFAALKLRTKVAAENEVFDVISLLACEKTVMSASFLLQRHL